MLVKSSILRVGPGDRRSGESLDPIMRRVLKWFVVLAFLLSSRTLVVGQTGEDVVFIRRAGTDVTAKRRGTIVEWKGLSLTLASNGAEREIDNDEIFEVQTRWSDAYLEGVALLKTGKVTEAIEKLQAALKDEKRPWANRIIRSHLIDAFQTVNQPGAAVDQFVGIIEGDPNTRFLYLAPLPWFSSGASLDAQASKWIVSRKPAIQLLGASWLLGGPRRAEGVKVLGELTLDLDARIKDLATAQLWRTRANVNSKQVNVWKGIVSRMPRSLRAGPYLVLAEIEARTGQVDNAVLSLMRIPILYPEQRTLSAAALYRAANLLRNQGELKQAEALVNELVLKYPSSLWAQQMPQSSNH